MHDIDVDIVILLTILGFSAVVTNAAYAESQEPKFDFWASFGYWLDRAGIAGVAVTLFVYLLQQRSTRNKERHRRKETFENSRLALLGEISGNQDKLSLSNRLLFSYVRSKQTIDFANIIFDTYAYQSIIHSGLLTDFGEEAQSLLAQLYSRIDFHNESLKYRSRLETEFSLFGKPGTQGNWLGEKEKYDLILSNTEAEIRQLFPLVERSLKPTQ